MDPYQILNESDEGSYLSDERSYLSGSNYQNPQDLFQDHWMVFMIIFIAFLGSIAAIFYYTNCSLSQYGNPLPRTRLRLEQWVKNRRAQQYQEATDKDKVASSPENGRRCIDIQSFISTVLEDKDPIHDDNHQRIFSRKNVSQKMKIEGHDEEEDENSRTTYTIHDEPEYENTRITYTV
jgi:hypothetical protein